MTSDAVVATAGVTTDTHNISGAACAADGQTMSDLMPNQIQKGPARAISPVRYHPRRQGHTNSFLHTSSFQGDGVSEAEALEILLERSRQDGREWIISEAAYEESINVSVTANASTPNNAGPAFPKAMATRALRDPATVAVPKAMPKTIPKATGKARAPTINEIQMANNVRRLSREGPATAAAATCNLGSEVQTLSEAAPKAMPKAVSKARAPTMAETTATAAAGAARPPVPHIPAHTLPKAAPEQKPKMTQGEEMRTPAGVTAPSSGSTDADMRIHSRAGANRQAAAMTSTLPPALGSEAHGFQIVSSSRRTQQSAATMTSTPAQGSEVQGFQPTALDDDELTAEVANATSSITKAESTSTVLQTSDTKKTSSNRELSEEIDGTHTLTVSRLIVALERVGSSCGKDVTELDDVKFGRLFDASVNDMNQLSTDLENQLANQSPVGNSHHISPTTQKNIRSIIRSAITKVQTQDDRRRRNESQRAATAAGNSFAILGDTADDFPETP
jgi:hypothetical protein